MEEIKSSFFRCGQNDQKVRCLPSHFCSVVCRKVHSPLPLSPRLPFHLKKKKRKEKEKIFFLVLEKVVTKNVKLTCVRRWTFKISNVKCNGSLINLLLFFHLFSIYVSCFSFLFVSVLIQGEKRGKGGRGGENGWRKRKEKDFFKVYPKHFNIIDLTLLTFMARFKENKSLGICCCCCCFVGCSLLKKLSIIFSQSSVNDTVWFSIITS